MGFAIACPTLEVWLFLSSHAFQLAHRPTFCHSQYQQPEGLKRERKTLSEQFFSFPLKFARHIRRASSPRPGNCAMNILPTNRAPRATHGPRPGRPAAVPFIPWSILRLTSPRYIGRFSTECGHFSLCAPCFSYSSQARLFEVSTPFLILNFKKIQPRVSRRLRSPSSWFSAPRAFQNPIPNPDPRSRIHSSFLSQSRVNICPFHPRHPYLKWISHLFFKNQKTHHSTTFSSFPSLISVLFHAGFVAWTQLIKARKPLVGMWRSDRIGTELPATHDSRPEFRS